MASLLEQVLLQLAADPQASSSLASLTGGAQAPAGAAESAVAPGFTGSRTASDFLSGAMRFAQRHPRSKLAGMAGGGGEAVDRDGAGGLAEALGSIPQQGAETLGDSGLFVNRRAGSENEGLVGQLLKLEDGRKASVYYGKGGRRRVNVWPT